MAAADREFGERTLCASPLTGPLLERWAGLRLADGWLVAVAQTIWNAKSGLPPDHGIRDIDIVYFDATDLSAETEAAEDARIQSLLHDLPVAADVKNEARVHLWYEARFGAPILPYQSVQAAIATFPTTATAIGVRMNDGRLEIQAPFGLADLCALVVRPNTAQVTAEIYEAKVSRWRDLWPSLDIRLWRD